MDVDHEERRKMALHTVVSQWRRQNKEAAKAQVEKAGLDPAEFGLAPPPTEPPLELPVEKTN